MCLVGRFDQQNLLVAIGDQQSSCRPLARQAGGNVRRSEGMQGPDTDRSTHPQRRAPTLSANVDIKLRQNSDIVVLPRAAAAIDNGNLTMLLDPAAAVDGAGARSDARRCSADPERFSQAAAIVCAHRDRTFGRPGVSSDG